MVLVKYIFLFLLHFNIKYNLFLKYLILLLLVRQTDNPKSEKDIPLYYKLYI